MMEKSMSTNSDTIIYDLEDSVPPSVSDKDGARTRLQKFLTTKSSVELPSPDRIAVRLNAINTPFFRDDIALALRFSRIRTLVLPKVNSGQDLHHVAREIYTATRLQPTRNPENQPLRLVASIESANSLLNLREIAGWQSEYGPNLMVSLSALLVCVNYKDLDYLKEECEDGRRLGFNGKQAIHPSQVAIIQSTFVPNEKEILRAARILHRMKMAHDSQKGAIGLELEGGGKEMIDAPMIKQAENVIRIAKSADLEIPRVD
ncbi:hypothetical protein AcV5_007566 [Taiwanofungus camphoratus]|nr:hypothetical protein AcV5_007566 [Antrodia cinnamomea]